jgi:PAS domain S-box-containing protein
MAAGPDGSADPLVQRTDAGSTPGPGVAGGEGFDELFELLPDHLWIAGEDGRLLRANRRMTGYAGHGLEGRHILDLMPPEDASRFGLAWRLAVRDGSGFEARIRILRADGLPCRFHLRVVPRRAGDGSRQWLGVCTDIEEQARVQADLERAMQAQRRAFATANHDLRQPLSAILFLTATLRDKVTAESERQMLQAIGNSVHAMKVMVDNQVDFARLTAGTLRAVPADVPVNALLTRLALEFAPLAAAKGLAFSVRPCSALVRSDPQLLERMLRNLLFNAVRYTKEGRVVLGCRRAGGRLRIEVLDSGRGIDAEERARLSEPFFRSTRSVHEHPGGLGLGLAVVDRIGRVLGHELSLRTVEGRGSAFCLTVPLSEEGSEEILRRARPDRPRILVLAGDEALPPAVIEALGAEVEHFPDEAAAAAFMAGGGWLPDTILCGLNHRGSADGVLRLRRLLGLVGEGARGILLCTSPEPVRLREMVLSGYPYLVLPLPPAEIQSRLLEILFRRA